MVIKFDQYLSGIIYALSLTHIEKEHNIRILVSTEQCILYTGAWLLLELLMRLKETIKV